MVPWRLPRRSVEQSALRSGAQLISYSYHLGNICCRLGRDARFDPKTETFGHDKEANALLTKEYQASYTLPEV